MRFTAMRMLIVTVVVSVLTFGAAADEYPDLRGTWQGDVESVFLDIRRLHQQGWRAAIFGAFPVTLVVRRQDGRRFAGTVDIDGLVKPIVGVLTTTSTMWWTHQDRVVEARLLDRDAIDHCYIRPGETVQSAACGVLRRESP